MESTQAVAHTMEISPRRPDGILDMIGPRTLEGGYSSPSQVISSAMEREVKVAEEGMVVCWVEIAEWGIGANAADTARIAERRRKVSLAILFISVVCVVAVVCEEREKVR